MPDLCAWGKAKLIPYATADNLLPARECRGMVVEIECLHCHEKAVISKPLDLTVFWYNHEPCHKGIPSIKIKKQEMAQPPAEKT